MLFLNNKIFSKIKLDWVFIISLGLLAVIGLLVLYSTKQDWGLVQRQLLRWGLGFMLLLIVSNLPPFIFRAWASLLYWSLIGLLCLVLLLGSSAKGAQRWLNLGFIRFQPAEIMKLGLPIYLAYYFDLRQLPPTAKDILISLIWIGLPVGLVALQPDLGTAILIGVSGGFILFFAGISWRYVFGLLGLIILSMPLIWHVLHDYQKNRILTLLSPERDPLGRGYQIIQSKIAIGSGGWQGKGWLGSTQSNLDYLPDRSTDFIFSVFSEQFGLAGVLLLFGLYLFIILKSLEIGVHAKGTFSKLLAGSLTMTFFTYLAVNVGMVCGLLPVVGIPLPFISYGGTALLTLMVSFGLLLSIKHQKTLVLR